MNVIDIKLPSDKNECVRWGFYDWQLASATARACASGVGDLVSGDVTVLGKMSPTERDSKAGYAELDVSSRPPHKEVVWARYMWHAQVARGAGKPPWIRYGSAYILTQLQTREVL